VDKRSISLDIECTTFPPITDNSIPVEQKHSIGMVNEVHIFATGKALSITFSSYDAERSMNTLNISNCSCQQ
jgi:hypothetical protein